MIRRFRAWYVFFGLLALGGNSLLASTTCNSNGTVDGVNICWKFPSQAGTWTTGTLTSPACTLNGTVQCGYVYQPTGTTGWSSLNGAYGWHGYNPATDGTPQAFLNVLTAGTGLAITLTNDSSLHNTNGTLVGLTWRPPTADGGYFLSTYDKTNTPGITLDFSSSLGGGIKNFDFYWGSVDTWNKLTFTDTQNNVFTFPASDLPSYASDNGFINSPSNTNSILVNFSVPSGGYPWKSVKFTSCNNAATPYCAAAFEFDNLEWVNGNTCDPKCGTLTSSQVPSTVPEPSSLALLGSGFASVVMVLRRKVTRQGR